jgi:hypothetical protein
MTNDRTDEEKLAALPADAQLLLRGAVEFAEGLACLATFSPAADEHFEAARAWFDAASAAALPPTP